MKAGAVHVKEWWCVYCITKEFVVECREDIEYLLCVMISCGKGCMTTTMVVHPEEWDVAWQSSSDHWSVSVGQEFFDAVRRGDCFNTINRVGRLSGIYYETDPKSRCDAGAF